MTPLESICGYMLRNRGWLYEADMFSILLESPWVVRCFEFALADGAVNCGSLNEYTKSQGYAERFTNMLDCSDDERSILLFDVKSSTSAVAGSQSYIGAEGQRQQVAFWICICAADPTFVELIPNMSQSDNANVLPSPDAESAADGQETAKKRELAINITKQSKLPIETYSGLDQCGSPYRMPISHLVKAIEQVRCCVLNGTPYQNPWTRVVFQDWSPKPTKKRDHIRPAEDTAQFSACQAVLEIFRHARNASIKPEFTMLQPRLADFKFMLRNSGVYYVQHKLDDTIRKANDDMHRVTAARGGDSLHYYFRAAERFDFLWYQFRLSNSGKGLHRNEVYFLPERVLPDDFFSSIEKDVSFDRPDFQEYRFEMKEDGAWVDDVVRIIQSNPKPRAEHERPWRKLSALSKAPVASQTTVPQPTMARKGKGRREYAEILQHSMRKFFYNMMDACARRGRGLFTVWATNHPLGDLGFTRYSWSTGEQEAWLHKRRMPAANHHLPPDIEQLALCYYTQDAECRSHGPQVRARQFRRLDSTNQARLILWDLGGRDAVDISLLPVVIPSDDITASSDQRELFRHGLTAKPNERKDMPLLHSLLRTGLYPSEYAIMRENTWKPERDPWLVMLDFLDRFLETSPIMHPDGHQRSPASYRHSLEYIHQSLVEQQIQEGPGVVTLDQAV